MSSGVNRTLHRASLLTAERKDARGWHGRGRRCMGGAMGRLPGPTYCRLLTFLQEFDYLRVYAFEGSPRRYVSRALQDLDTSEVGHYLPGALRYRFAREEYVFAAGEDQRG